MTNAILRRQKFVVHKSWKSMMSIGYRASVYIIMVIILHTKLPQVVSRQNLLLSADGFLVTN